MIDKYLVVEPNLADTLWDIYYPNMQRIQKNTPFRQGLTRDEFDAAMCDPSFIKFVLFRKVEAVGLVLIATEISKISWLSTDYFAENYGEEPTYYIVGLAVAEQHSKVSIVGGKNLLETVLTSFPKDGFCFYDHSKLLHESY
jgi:hypothetical protein